MSMRIGMLLFLAATYIWPARGQDQPKPAAAKPGAKEMFLTRQFVPHDQDEPATPASPNAKPAGTKAKPKKPKPTTDEAAVKGQVQAGQPAPEHAVPIIRVSESGVPLGLRYTVQKTDGEHGADVPAGTIFHTGEHIQLKLEVNDTGYLYVVSQGSSHKWSALFPSAEVNGDNRVERGHVYTVPPGTKAITFDETPGAEHLFVIFSRQPVAEIDSLIFSLKGGQPTPASDAGRERPAGATLMASARPIEDSQIAAMRNTYTRDLIIEDLGQEQSPHAQEGQPQDQSVYVVNPKGSADSRVVADISLNHRR